MRPPICAICHDRFSPDEGGLVSYERDPADAGWYERAKTPGFVGHPPHQEWFCGRHIEAARALSGMTRRGALAKLRPPAD